MLTAFAIACGLAMMAGGIAIYALQTNWFKQQVRERIVSAAEQASGGRVELGSFTYNWRMLTAEFTGFVVHGTEPAGAPPLFRADSVRVGLRLVSLFKRDVDVAYLRLDRPEIHLLVRPDGTTNLPQPKVSTSANLFLQQLFSLNVRRFEFKDGLLQVDAQRFPLTVRGNGLRVLLSYERSASQYKASLSSDDVQVQSNRLQNFSGRLTAGLRLGRDRLLVDDLVLKSEHSQLQAHGALLRFANPLANLALDAHIAAADLASLAGLSSLPGGELDLRGALRYDAAADFTFAGSLSGRKLVYRSSTFALRNIDISSLVLARRDQLTLTKLSLNPFGSTVQGDAVIKQNGEFQFTGKFFGGNLRQVNAFLPRFPIPWGGVASGTLRLSGALNRRNLTLQTAAHIAPASSGIPVSGDLDLSYRQLGEVLIFGNSHFDLPHTQISFSGTAGQNLRLTLTSTDLNDLKPTFSRTAPTVFKNGEIHFDGTLSGPLANPYIQGNVAAAQLEIEKTTWRQVRSYINLAEGGIDFSGLTADSNLLRITGSGHLGLEKWALQPASALRLNAQFERADLASLSPAFIPLPVHLLQGSASGSLNLSGTLSDPRGLASLKIDNLDAYGVPVNSVRVEADLEPGHLRITRGTVRAGAALLIFSGGYRHENGLWQGGEIELKADSNGFPLTSLAPVQSYKPGLQALVEVHLRASARVTAQQILPTHADGTLILRSITLKGVPYGSVTAGVSTYGQTLDADFSGALRDTHLSGRAQIQLVAGLPVAGEIHLNRISLPTLYALATANPAHSIPFDGFLQGTVTLSGPLEHLDQIHGTVKLDELQLSSSLPNPALPGRDRSNASELIFRNTGPILLDAAKGTATIRSFEIRGKDTTLSARGSIPYLHQRPIDLSLRGSADLRIFQLFDPNVRSSGQSVLNTSISGTLADPIISGTLQLRDGSFFLEAVPNGLIGVNGTVNFDRDRATIQKLTARTGGGEVSLGGFVTYGAGSPLVYRLEANAENVRMRYGGSASVTANASLRLTGTSKNSVLSGTFGISRAAFTPNTDVGNLLADISAPSAAPANERDFLTGLQLDIHLENTPDFQLSTALSRDVEASIDLRLRGTPAHPILLGSISANQGDIKVFGTKYSINRGEVSFVNPVKIEPVLNLDLQTQARGIIVDITISGALGKLNINYRSDPPLQPRDIIALLTVGHTPDIAANISSAQTSAGGALQTNANTVLGAAISPGSSRLQKLFGVANIKIDPMVQGITNTMQRLTIEQQISRNITVTYVTNLSQTSEQIFRFEWALSPQYSLVALRDDNGEFGIDIQYKKRFK